jgi:oxalate decarboxylase/phosphoglucose isomerase-like protein (cupin superfamily)
LELLGTASTASEGVVDDQELQLAPQYRPGQLLETVPGLIVTLHSGEGKANQYLMRGYNLDHGTDLETYVDGMPINQPTHAHGQGYTDLNFMIPELADQLTYTKGPYYANVGDFGAVGSVRVNYRDTIDDQVSATVYITPGNAAGFTPHYDTHEVFVLQIAGRKRWFLYDPPIELPHRSQVFNPQGYTAPPPMAQLDLSAGDLLYLPRGYVHSTTTSESYSAHVTIGISVYTWADLAKEYLQAGIDSPQLRRALPPGFASRSELKPLLREKMIAAMDKIRTGADTEKLIDAFTRRVRASRTKRPESFRADTFVIDSQSRLQAPAPSEYKITQESTKIVLEFEGRRHIFPTEALAALRAIAERPSFRTAELTQWSTAEARLGLSRYLYDIGFLTSVQ